MRSILSSKSSILNDFYYLICDIYGFPLDLDPISKSTLKPLKTGPKGMFPEGVRLTDRK